MKILKAHTTIAGPDYGGIAGNGWRIKMFRYLLGFSFGIVAMYFPIKLIDDGYSLQLALSFAAVFSIFGACFNAWTIKYFGE